MHNLIVMSLLNKKPIPSLQCKQLVEIYLIYCNFCYANYQVNHHKMLYYKHIALIGFKEKLYEKSRIFFWTFYLHIIIYRCKLLPSS